MTIKRVWHGWTTPADAEVCEALQNVVDFQGEDYARAYVPEAAQRVLKRWDPVSAHFEVRETRRHG